MIILSKIKPIYFFVVLVIIVIPIIILLFTLFSRAKQGNNATPKTIYPETTTAPTIQTIPGETIHVLRVDPVDTTLFYLPVQPVELTFSDEVLPNTIKYTVSPNTETKVRQGEIPSSIIIIPVKKWAEGTTTITVTTDTKSSSGLRLAENFIYQLNTSLPPTIPPGSEDY